MEDDPMWKKTSKIKTWNISATIGLILLKFEMLAHRTKTNVIEHLNEDDLSWKMTPCGTRPQNYNQEHLSNHWSNLTQI